MFATCMHEEIRGAGGCPSPAALPGLLRRRARMVQLQALVLAEDLPLRLHGLLRLAAHGAPALRMAVGQT
jgi:hypothetical protein